MSVIGNPISIGGGKAQVVAFTIGREAYNDWRPDDGGIYGGYWWADGKNFERIANGVFECLKAGTVNVYCYIKGGYNTSGNYIGVSARIYKNSTIIATKDSTTSSGATFSVSNVAVAVGDTIKILQRNTSGATAQSGSIVICKSDIDPVPFDEQA